VRPKCSLKLYSNFLIANHNRYSGVELARVAPDATLAHDAVNRWLGRADFTSRDLWREVKPLVTISTGYLVCDDTLLDKRYSRENELARLQYSGNAHGLVNGIVLVNLLWTDGTEFVPVDYRFYDKTRDDKTKNDHFCTMLEKAHKRDFTPQYVLMDSWYGSVANLKQINQYGWQWITNLKSNRQVSETKGVYCAISDLNLGNEQLKHVWLKEYGNVIVGKLVATNGDIVYLATNDLTFTNYQDLTDHWHHRWMVEEFHRGIKQTTGIAKCYSIKATSQKAHIFAAFTAFIRLEKRRLKTAVSWYEQKALIVRSATREYLTSA